MVSPQAAALIAFCTLPPAGTVVTLPGDGVFAIAVLMQACGSAATVSFPPKLATSPVPQYVLSAPVEGGGGGGGGPGVGGVTETVAWDDLVVSATLRAVTVTVVDDVTVGAVNMPLLDIVPMLADQVTLVFEVLLTVAVNCWVPADSTVVEFGETVTLTAAGGLMVSEEWADLVVSATLVAVTVALVDEVTLGAVNSPLLEMVPPLAVQVTAVFEVLLTVAVNCWVPPEIRVDEVGETATLTADGGFTVTVD